MRVALLLLFLASCLVAEASDLSLLDAVRAGNVDAVRSLLQSGQDAMAKDLREGTALHLAAQSGNAKMVLLLLERGARVDAAGVGGSSALQVAVQAGHREAARTLLENGAEANQRDHKGQTPVFAASTRGDLPMLELLASKHADLVAKDRDGNFPLLLAAEQGREDALSWLVQHQVRVSDKDANGRTALMAAAARGSARMVKELVAAGAMLDARASDEGGVCAFYSALLNGYRKIGTFLLERGALPVVKRSDGGVDFAVLRTACDLKRLPEHAEALKSIKCENLLEPGNYAACGEGELKDPAVLTAVEIPEANVNLIKPPELRYLCPKSGGHVCVLDLGDDDTHDWRRTLRFVADGSLLWSPQACAAGCGYPKVELRRLVPVRLKGKKSVDLLRRPVRCPARGKCAWKEARGVQGSPAGLEGLFPARDGFVCVRVPEGEDSARFGWVPQALVDRL